MRRIQVDALAPSSALLRPLYHESGALLFAAGERVGDEEVALLRRSGIRRVYDLGGEEPPGDESRGMLALAATTRDGGAPPEPAVAPEDVARFRRERRATAALRAIERAAGARLADERLILDPRGELRNGGVDRALARSRAGELPEGTPWRERLAGFRPEAPRSAEEKSAALELRASIVARLAALFADLRGGGAPAEAGVVGELARSVSALALRDPEVAVALAIGPAAGVAASDAPGAAERALARHSFAVAVLSLATAIELGYGLEQLVEIAGAALLHDVGMVRLPEALAAKAGPLDEEERRELERHPLHAIEVLRRFPQVPVALAAVALEEHERPDGSGYPRGTGEPGELARIVGVADVFEAVAAARPHRPARPPHEAVREVVALASKKRLDAKVLRALLKAISLFPVGSFVRLSSGGLGRVVRAGGPDASRPLVALLGEDARLVDLAAEAEVKIAEADVASERVEAFASDPLVGF